MTFKRGILVVLTVLAVWIIGGNLWESLSKPQFQNRLELYQTNLVLQVTELRGDDPSLASARKALAGSEPLKSATEQYQNFQQTAQKTLERAKPLLTSSSISDLESLQASVAKQESLIAELDLKLGILKAEQQQVNEAQAAWEKVIQQANATANSDSLSKTAQALSGLWSTPPQLLPNAEQVLKKTLDGWFRYQALNRLYQLQQRQEALTALEATEQQAAERAFNSLAIVGGIPIVGCLIGVGILLFLGVQWLIQRKQALLAPDGIAPWSTPWDGEVIWQVLIFGFFLVGQVVSKLLLPLAVSLLQVVAGLNVAAISERTRAVFILLDYFFLAAGGLTVLYLSIKPFLPLPEGWFQFRLKGNWVWWGLGGYFAALPLVIAISAVNQKIWQGQGGSNPILPIVLEGKDSITLAIFFGTAAIAAPIFEEILFRGFLLPSLTRYFPVWGAIALSSLIFAVAHLSLSEVLPLTVLGMVLGFVYARSRNLLASMLLHSLWNSGTLLSLFVLGSNAS